MRKSAISVSAGDDSIIESSGYDSGSDGAHIMTRTQSRRAFTLVELLVVIGIIALLVSILLPALNKAKESSRQVKCLSNLKQLGNATMQYVNDNKGVLPAAAGGSPAYHWPGPPFSPTPDPTP